MRDLDRFKRQKTKDLKEIFTNYAIMQIKQCKKVLHFCITLTVYLYTEDYWVCCAQTC